MTEQEKGKGGDVAAGIASGLPEVWVAYIDPFASAIGKGVEEVTEALKSLVGDPGEEAVGLLQSAEFTPDKDIVDAVGIGVPKAKLAKAISGLRRKVESTVSDAPVMAMMGSATYDMLPAAPDDGSWLQALRAGGVLKVDKSTVVSAVRAALAHRAGLFDIPRKLVARMEEFADSNDEPVPAEFYSLRKQITRRTYAEVFEAIDGLDGNFVTDARIKQLLGRIDDHLWPGITLFYEQLKAWMESWQQGTSNPNALLALVLSLGGGATNALPPGIMQPPETGALRDQADAFSDSVNRVFAGTGAQIASAIAFDATRIRDTLQNPQLPALIGAANREQMLKMLGVNVTATYPRMETNMIRFVLAIMNVSEVPAGNEELQYFSSLCMLGSQIPWSELGAAGHSPRRAGISGSL
jgi:hypothetical protein